MGLANLPRGVRYKFWILFQNKPYGRLQNIEIPETVELIGNQAFSGNDKIVSADGALNSDRFKLRNSNTVIIS